MKNWRFPQLGTGCSAVCIAALHGIFQVPDWYAFHIDSQLNRCTAIFQVRLAGTAEAICLTLYQEGQSASWDCLGIFLNEIIVLWSSSGIENVHHISSAIICFFFFFFLLVLTLGLKMVIEKCLMAVFWCGHLWHILHKCPASWTGWLFSEPCVTLWP